MGNRKTYRGVMSRVADVVLLSAERHRLKRATRAEAGAEPAERPHRAATHVASARGGR